MLIGVPDSYTALAFQNIDVDQIVMEHYQSTCTPRPLISKLPVTPTLRKVDIAKHEEAFLPSELCSNCSHGFKVSLILAFCYIVMPSNMSDS